jgi:hypothetical protein
MGFYDLRNCVFGNHQLGSDRPIGMNPSQRWIPSQALDITSPYGVFPTKGGYFSISGEIPPDGWVLPIPYV